MKVTVSEELKNRLVFAAANGSVVAGGILAELKKNADAADMIRGSANYFSTKRKRQDAPNYRKVKIVFTACTKDITHPDFPDANNPEAPWFSENRTDMEPSTFAGCFKNLPGYETGDMDFFISAICVNSKVTVRLYDRMSDFYDAYTGDNYSGTAQFGDSSLHGSCMRSEENARNAADFYRNFAGAKIIVARDAQQNILGCAIVWERVTDGERDTENTFSVLDRIYFSHDFVISLIRDYAQSIGIHLRKKQNTHSSCDEFVALNDVDALELARGESLYSSSLKIKVPATRWHKKGAPYLDTFFMLSLHRDGCFYLCNNSEDGDCFAVCRSTGGFATVERNICPSCNGVFNPKNDEQLCPRCMERYCTETVFGNIIFGRSVKYRGNSYPSFLFKNGKPNMYFRRYLQVQKLYS